MKSKKSQVTIFIIIGLIVIVAISMVVMILRDSNLFAPSKETDAQDYVANCIRLALEKAEKEVLESNGYHNKTDNYILYSLNKPQEKVPYLCKSSQFYTPCVNQEPLLIEHFRAEIEKKTKDESEKCFAGLFQVLSKSGYTIKEGGNKSYRIEFEEGAIIADITRVMTIERADVSKEYTKFSTSIQSPMYRLVDTARNIVNFESTICEFDEIRWMMYYTDISIYRFVTSDGTKIYSLTDRKSEKKLDFAVRTCNFPAGI